MFRSMTMTVTAAAAAILVSCFVAGCGVDAADETQTEQTNQTPQKADGERSQAASNVASEADTSSADTLANPPGFCRGPKPFCQTGIARCIYNAPNWIWRCPDQL